MAKPVAVIAGDIHYSLSTLSLADTATRMAITKANELNVPFIANGDTHDSKANLRGECVNAMIETFKTAKVRSIINIGNHCKINEKSTEHSLNFLRPYANIVDQPTYFRDLNAEIIPYYSNVEALREWLHFVPTDRIIILHQGILGSDSGEYYNDPTALNHNDVAHFRVIGSHYHRRQTIDTGKGNKFDYIGNPYTLGFGEANHPEKGFQILMSDGSLEFVPTNLRKHIVIDDTNPPKCMPKIEAQDLVWVKTVEGVTKQAAKERYLIQQDFRFEVIPNETVTIKEPIKNLRQEEVLDNLIASLTNTDQTRKERLQDMWKKLVRED